MSSRNSSTAGAAFALDPDVLDRTVVRLSAQPGGGRLAHPEREGRRHRSIDRVPARFEDDAPGGGGLVVSGGHHATPGRRHPLERRRCRRTLARGLR